MCWAIPHRVLFHGGFLLVYVAIVTQLPAGAAGGGAAGGGVAGGGVDGGGGVSGSAGFNGYGEPTGGCPTIASAVRTRSISDAVRPWRARYLPSVAAMNA